MTKQDEIIKYIYKLKTDNKILDGSFIPSENAIIIARGVSRNTVRLALKKLVESNILIPIKGKGYIFNDSKSRTLRSFVDEYGVNAKSVFLKERYVEEYDDHLKTKGYWEIIKVRYEDDRPFILTYQRITSIMMSRFTSNIYRQSLYSALRQKGEKISFAKKQVRYVKTSQETKYLLPGIKENSLLLFSETKDINNKTLEVSYNYYIPENFSWSWIEKTFK